MLSEKTKKDVLILEHGAYTRRHNSVNWTRPAVAVGELVQKGHTRPPPRENGLVSRELGENQRNVSFEKRSHYTKHEKKSTGARNLQLRKEQWDVNCSPHITTTKIRGCPQICSNRPDTFSYLKFGPIRTHNSCVVNCALSAYLWVI